MTKDKSLTLSSGGQIDAFLRQAAKLPVKTGARGRLLFALDATASREPLWDQACAIQADMFEAAGRIGGLDVQLCYYRGHREFQAKPWTAAPQSLAEQMGDVRCRAGATQIHRVLKHAVAEAGRQRIQALVFVGDAVEEAPQLLYDLAGKLAILGVPAFLFQEGSDTEVRKVFERVARLTRGAYASFDQASAQRLRELLCAVAVYASGGVRALERYCLDRGQDLKMLTRQISGER